jgi:hypothetical protein
MIAISPTAISTWRRSTWAEAAARAFGVDGSRGFVGVHRVGFAVGNPHVVRRVSRAAGERVIEPPTERGRDDVHFAARVYGLRSEGHFRRHRDAWPDVGR